ncbi:MAG: glycosyltransferase family 4 protein [Phycisphaerae bacterium]|nr:glycosyltransferase family 4 protein [Phycisphaerae bacterium]
MFDQTDDPRKPLKIRRLAVIGNYVPRQCGIATFTTDLCEALVGEYEDLSCLALAVNDTDRGYAYPTRVRFELAEQELASYRRAAEFLDLNNVDLVCVQHEFGIFGGPAGSHILKLLKQLRMPVVTTLHTVLNEPEPEYRAAMLELAHLSDRLVTMSQRGVEFLKDIYDIPAAKIDFIPHGIPDVPFVDPSFHKDQFGVEGKYVVLTFGLLSPNKGIEFAIQALPKVVKKYPNVAYIVLGATHPHLKRMAGEKYRESLQQMAADLGVADNVIFHNRFVDLDKLVEYLGAADLYVTPYLNEAQITSGTLAYAVGAGKAVVSTPYWHAEELLADGRGRLVPFGDADAIANEMLSLLDDETERHALRKRAYMYGREMVWSAVARRYMRAFIRVREERTKQPRGTPITRPSDRRPTELPAINIEHLRRMTDDTGMYQHAVGKLPNYDHGYCTDDNARALILTVLLEDSDDEEVVATARRLSERYLAFLWHSFNKDSGRFRNFMSYDRHWLDEGGSEDSHGRALWALGTMAGRSSDSRARGVAGRLFTLALPAAREVSAPRTWAYILIAIHEYMRRFYGDSVAQNVRETLAERLFQAYQQTCSSDWKWFEYELTYANAKLPQALLLCGRWMMRGEMSEAALQALDWLAHVQTAEEGHFVPIGNQGFYRRAGERARFDQQPIEAHAMVSACLEAHQVTGDKRWWNEARRAFEWFLGRNDVGLPLYDQTTGGCHDGLHPQRVNQNQGAESTLAFLLALSEMRNANAVMRRAEESKDER